MINVLIRKNMQIHSWSVMLILRKPLFRVGEIPPDINREEARTKCKNNGRLTIMSVSQLMPDIPALAEHPAFKNVDINSWFAMMGPANMPAPVVAKIKEALNKTMAAPEFRKKMEDAGAQVMDSQIDASQYINGEIAKYQKIIDVAKIEL